MVRKLLSIAALAVAFMIGSTPSTSEAGYLRFNVRGPGYGRVYYRGTAPRWSRGGVYVTPGYYSGGYYGSAYSGNGYYVNGGYYAPSGSWYGW